MKKQWLALQFTALLFVAGAFALLNAHTARAGDPPPLVENNMEGSGIPGDPYLVNNCTDLQNIGLNMDSTYILTQDIDCGGSNAWNDGKGFIPIGLNTDGSQKEFYTFWGSLDGRGHTVSNLFIDRGSETSAVNRYTGLFANVGGKLDNLKLTNATIIGPGSGGSYYNAYVGGFVGSLSGSINHVSFSGSISTQLCLANPLYVGGLAGYSSSGSIEVSSSTGSITSTNNNCGPNSVTAGGIAGGLNSSTLRNSYSAMDITVSGQAGEPCSSNCRAVGGLVGSSYNGGSISKSYATGSLSVLDTSESNVSYSVGGLIGQSNTAGDSVQDLFAATPITTPPACIDDVCGPGIRSAATLIGSTHNGYVNYGLYETIRYDQTIIGLENCDDDPINVGSCHPVNTDGLDPDYFKNNSTNTPLDEWDFTDTWQTTNAYPILRDSVFNPNKATGLVATVDSLTRIHLSWEQPVNDDNNTWNILCQKVGDPKWFTCAENVEYQFDEDTGIYNADIEGLESATQYNIKVVAEVKSTHTWGEASDSVLGTTATPGFHLITNCQQLQNMTNELSGHYELAGNIDCSDTVNWNGGAGFIPVGEAGFDGVAPENMFRGVFAGNTYTITNLYTNQQVGGWVSASLFGGTYNALIQDVKLVNPVSIGKVDGLAAGLVGFSVKTDIINAHITNGTVTGGGIVMGGLAAYAYNETADPSQQRYNEFTGTIQVNEGVAYYVGGLYGLFAGAVNVHDNFSNAAITTNGSFSVGGFVGFVIGGEHDVEGLPVLTNNYASGSISYTGVYPTSQDYSTQEEVFPPTGGGLIGIAEGPGPVSNNFAHVAIDGFTYSGGIVGLAQDPDILGLFSNNYFDADQAGTADCMGELGGSCGVISGQPNYFKNNSTNPPLDQWDFVNTWKVTSQFPVFDARVIATITAIDPNRLNPPLPEGGSGGGSVSTPSNPTAAASVTQAITGTKSSNTGPADETGLLGAIKQFVRSLPAGVVTAFPYALFGLLFLAVIILLIELYRELRRLRLLQILIHKQQLLAEERDAFWHLAANYLRAPVTLIVGGTEALNDVKRTTTTISLSEVASGLQGKIAEIMKKIEGSTSLQAISQTAPRPVTRTARRAAFIIPVVTVATLAILGNYAAASFRNMSPGTTGYLAQIAIFIVVAIIFYWTLGLLSRGKSKRQAAQAQLDRQTNELANARHELINDTAKNLNPDLTKLEELIAKLPTKQAASQPAKTLQEGSSRLRDIVTSFTMLIKVQEGTGQVAGATPTINLTTLLNKTRAKLTPQITSKGVRVIAPALPLAVHAEAEMANQVLESIISNAVDYSPANGTVKVEAKKLQDTIQLRISDQGKGIDKKQLDHLFQPFVRTDGKSAMDMSHGGFGINLYLDKLIMEQLGGSISATSTPGKGTAITMEWPV